MGWIGHLNSTFGSDWGVHDRMNIDVFSPYRAQLLFELGSMKGGCMWAEEGRFDLCAAGLRYQFVPELDKAHKLVGKFHYLVTTEFRQYGHKEGRKEREKRENPNCQLQSSSWHSAHLLTVPFDFDLATDTA